MQNQVLESQFFLWSQNNGLDEYFIGKIIVNKKKSFISLIKFAYVKINFIIKFIRIIRMRILKKL